MKQLYLTAVCLLSITFSMAQCVTGVNIAHFRPATASSQESIAFPASNAFDDDPATRWSSQFSDPQFIYVDLQVSYELCQVVLSWETAYGTDFTIDISDDALSWTTVATITGNTSQSNIINITGTGRYVRMNGTARATAFGYSLNEFQVYAIRPVNACDPINQALNKPSNATSEQVGFPVAFAFDGDVATRWGSDFSDPQSIGVDLGAVNNLCQVVLNWEAAYATDYTIDGSLDSINWNTLATVTGNTSLINTINVGGAARYLRMNGTARATAFGYSLYEFQVFSSSILPVRLTYFNAEKMNKEVWVRWATAMESNSDQFVIERSNDGRNFTAIGKVKAAGSSNELRSYEFRDPAPLNGVNYYRLKQQDIDARFEYSKIAQVNTGNTQGTTVSIYPNPIDNIATFATANGERIQSISIYSLTGTLLKKQNNSSNSGTVQLSLQQFTAGTYVAEVLLNNSKQVYRIVKR
ncbi:MAG: discoidin domain-containing protein [Chitinophagaceae bacterium]